jgi:predicted NBD/HSP70 family sugar kinase
MNMRHEDEPLRPNQRRALAWLARVGEASRAQLAGELALPKATVSGIVADLVARGLVTEAPPEGRAPATGPGRPARVLSPTGPPAALGALSWSAGSLNALVVTLTGRVLAEQSAALAPDLGREAAAEQAVRCLAAAAAEAGYAVADLAALVLAVPAPIERAAVPAAGPARRYDWIPHWLDTELAAALEQRAGIAALVENDANLSALGEHAFGAGRGFSDQVYVKISRTGVGAGLVLSGRLHRGATGLAGELAHVQVRENGPLCGCGGRGCLMLTIRTELIDIAQPAYDEPLTFEVVLSLAAAGDVALQRLLGDLGRTIARPLADLCALLNPELLVLDGSLGPAGQHIAAGMSAALERHARPAISAAVQIVHGQLTTHAEALGAVALVGNS